MRHYAAAWIADKPRVQSPDFPQKELKTMQLLEYSYAASAPGITKIKMVFLSPSFTKTLSIFSLLFCYFQGFRGFARCF
jgi:hypothetical protein